MCGIAGFYGLKRGQEVASHCLQEMGDLIAHRGPDDQGIWYEPQHGVGFVHRRLSIIDLSPSGHQPMHSQDGRYTIIFNGEIYNFQELRSLLCAGGVAFKGHSDTEVILEGIARWGLVPTLEKMCGMFAIALWDKATKTLHLIRDRMGIKPLYWGYVKGTLVFGSQLSVFRAFDHTHQFEIDRAVLTSYLRFNYVPTPYSIYRDIYKLEPGVILSIDETEQTTKTQFWSLKEVALKGIATRDQVSLTEDEALNQFEQCLETCVAQHMLADVPLGAFLSGGYDSSLVVAMMQKLNTQKTKTFSIGFHVAGYDEAPHAKNVAMHLGTDHKQLYVEPQHALDVIYKLPHFYDEPFADASQIPTYLVSQMTAAHVKVVLSGDGGDELFAGYNRYHLHQLLASKLKYIPAPLRKAVAHLLQLCPPKYLNHFKGGGIPPLLGDKLHKFAEVLKLPPTLLYQCLVSQWQNPERGMLNGVEAQTVLSDDMLQKAFSQPLDYMQYVDMVSYLPDDILTKVDRASMAVSLEARVPLLDHRLVEFSWRLPQHMKIGPKPKWLLRQLLYRYVPKPLLERPKQGFSVPIDHWLRYELKDWAAHLLDANKLKAQGFFNPNTISTFWQEHQSGVRNWQYQLWPILMFQAWQEQDKILYL